MSPALKVRIGIGAGPSRLGVAEDTTTLVDGCERRGIDSLWFPDRIATDAVEPLTALGWAAGRTEHLKLGTGVVVLPGRNPAVVAHQLASLAVLAPKRILPVFGLQPATPAERTAYPVPGPRAAVLEEALQVVRRLLTEESVTHHGRFFTLDDAAVAPRPAQPLDLWLGGLVPAALRRVGRLADGWLASFVTPAEAADARRVIAEAADAAGREVEEDHYGTNLLVLPPGAAPDEVERALAATAKRRPEIEPGTLIARDFSEAGRLVGEFVDGGITKFVVRPATAPESWDDFLDAFTTELVPLEN
ncbi:TIGR03854 family LLM class F420-dependent oxidoreductase [Actinomycetospora endophytica]|uniref:TIGR03854 family LLM class F420-dependent oxidoreductase n=1 Tax=Actinomycetospora endophytica TaxID=2291215 RepID=A0ABS8PAN6_9PSEU|nr:TIGR03854 family LLM class F420-dependent oxidoreductase [Actinomycetospora endophytica]MCD2194486.1 TIGR03854 family LLM class F420-dependent oxidoreductase [Actinomycetospora endophytica]